MNINPCAVISQQALFAFVQGAVLVYLIFSLAILITAYLCRSKRIDGRDTLKYKPYLSSARHLTDVRS